MASEWMDQERLYREFGDVPVRFTGYYKYTFTYAASLPDGRRLLVFVGGDSDSIYRLDVGTDEVLAKLLDADSAVVESPAPPPAAGGE